MQAQTEKFLQKLSEWLLKFSDLMFRLSHRLFTLLQQAWERYQAINWPEIPLTPLQWVLLFYFIFAALFLWATPVLEASDELWHFGMVEHLRETQQLPVQDPENLDTIYRQEGSQPPLYYALAAALTSPIDISDAEQVRIENPHTHNIGNPGGYGNKNLVLHPVEAPPLQGTVLAIYLIRVAGVLMGAVTVWAVYRIGLLIAPHRPVTGIVAAVITAFNPMFLFIMASVNNDTLVIMLNALIIWLGVLTLREGFEWRRSLAIAFLVALASLTKLSALTIVPVIAFAAIWLALRDKDWKGLLLLGGSMLLVWLVLSGWWYYRNIDLYGELFGTGMMAQIAGVREPTEPFTISTFFNEFQGFRLSYWGVFGAFNIQTSALFYAMTDFVVFSAMFGVMFLVAQLMSIRDFSYARRELALLLFLLGVVLIGGIGLLMWTAQTNASQGRLMFPFIAAISPLLAVGGIELLWWMLFLLSPPDRSFVRAGDAVPDGILRQSIQWPVRILGVFALLIPIVTIAPSYQAPQPLDALPNEDSIVRVYADYGDVELVGYRHVDRRYVPGENVRLTFYWRVQEQSTDDYSVGLALVNPYGDALSNMDTYPGAGTLRTSTWEVGKIYPDTYEIKLPRNLNARYPFRVQVNWYDDTPDNTFTVMSADEQDITPILLQVGAVVQPNYSYGFVEQAVLQDIEGSDREFGSRFRLHSFAVYEPFTVELEWETVSTNIEEDYTAFVHIVDADGNLVGQYDVFPELPTHYWRIAESYVTRHPINFDADLLQPGEHQVWVGWYRNDGDMNPRLFINEGDEEKQADAFNAFAFTVNELGLPELPEFALPDDELTPEVTEDGLGANTVVPPNPTRDPFETEPAVTAEVTPETSETTPAEVTGEATDEATEAVTEEATAEATDDATEVSTAEVTPEVTEMATEEATEAADD